VPSTGLLANELYKEVYLARWAAGHRRDRGVDFPFQRLFFATSATSVRHPQAVPRGRSFFLLSGFVMVHVYGHELALDRHARWRHFAMELRSNLSLVRPNHARNADYRPRLWYALWASLIF